MGCGGSKSDAGVLQRADSQASNTSGHADAGHMTEDHDHNMHVRLQKLMELDEATKIPFILIELRGLGHQDGYIEVCGKDEYGVYDKIEEWLTNEWGCTKMEAGDLSEDTPVPFCDAMYKWTGFTVAGDEGLNNMGLATMKVVDFMAGELSWTLAVVNGGNVGKAGEFREQQVIFKAPHPMNLVAPHFMIELRSAGYIEVCADRHCVAASTASLDQLEVFFKEAFNVERLHGYEEFCNRYYKTGEGMFKERGDKGENNLGLLTTQVCDAVVKIPGWSLVTCNGGNYGEHGGHREQQLVFRWDDHPLGPAPHLMVELRDAGFVEVCGTDTDGVYAKFDKWLKSSWKCQLNRDLPGMESFSNKKYQWEAKDMMVSTGQVISFFHSHGWQMQVCSQGTVKIPGSDDAREQQIILRPGASGFGIVEPHLIIELYMGEGKEELYEQAEVTQVLGNQYIRMCPIGDCQKAVDEFHAFITDYMGGAADSDKYTCDVFLSRGLTDNNLGQWTMRVCDFMVDRLGWSFIVANVCNFGDAGQFREQQLVFRYDGDRREVPVSKSFTSAQVGMWREVPQPNYWTIPEVLSREVVQKHCPCDPGETASMQAIFDRTYKRILTRDRVYEYQASTNEEMPYRLEVVHVFRSEHSHLWWRFHDRLGRFSGADAMQDVKTRICPDADYVNKRLGEGEAYLFHGTNPSSAMSILSNGFTLDHAGKSTGTMFGYGVYLAECASKSDEYARDDGGGCYPGLMAMLVCRTLVGKPLVVHKAGDHIQQARDDGYDCVCGDRETMVNTYREFVFFDEQQIYPEFTVIYRRQYSQEFVPEFLRIKTTGTTGRFWQVKLDKGWASVSPEANRALLQAMKNGVEQVEVTIGSFEYVFDLKNKSQLNKGTGNQRQLRAPMVAP